MSVPDPGSSAAEDDVEEVLTIAIDDYPAAVQIAAAEGVRVESLVDRGLVDPVSVSLILLGSSLAVSTVVYLLEQRKGGQVFDLRPDAARPAYRSKDIAYGYVQLISADGSVSVEVKEPRGMFGQVLDTLRLLVKENPGADSGSLADRARDALGDIAAIRVAP